MSDTPVPAADSPASAELFQLLVASVQDYAIFALDPEGRIITWNPGAERAKGYTAGEIIGQHFSRFYSLEDKHARKPQKELEQAALEGRVEDEGWRVRKDGTRFWANVVITALRHPDGTLRGFAKITRDLTRRKELEEAERAGRLAAEHANRLKDEFLATVSHELRTPLNVMSGTLWRLRSGKEDDPASRERLITTLDRSVRLQIRLVEDLLDVSRMVTGKLHLDLQPVELGPVLEAAVEVVAPAARAKSITISTDLRPAGPILADPHRLQQVFWNLLSNSVKFTPAGGRVDVLLAREGLDAVVRVRDSGRGIESAFLPHLFEPFTQQEESRTRTEGGLGLGLSVVKHLTEAHGGSVEVASGGEGAGATFRVRFPVPALTVSMENMGPAVAALEDLPNLHDIRVLVVDDQADARESVLAVLSHCGANVRAVASAAEAMAALASFKPHVLLADIAMPGGDGFDLIEQVRRELPADVRGIPAAALTAYTSTATRLRILSAGYQMHLPKPMDPVELSEAVARLARDVAGAAGEASSPAI